MFVFMLTLSSLMLLKNGCCEDLYSVCRGYSYSVGVRV